MSASNDAKVKVSVITNYFNTIQRLNAKRALNSGCVLDFDEHDKVFKETLTHHGLRAELPFDGANRFQDRWDGGRLTEKFRGVVDNSRFPEKRGDGGSRNKMGKNGAKKVQSMVNGIRTCYDYNNGNCSRKSIPGGCIDSREAKFSHYCNYFIKDKSIFCHGKHARPDHP